MKRTWLGPAALLGVAAAIVAFKNVGAERSLDGPAAVSPKASAIILVADPREAQQTCGCGEIIRLVRQAATRGVPIQEIAPNSDKALQTRYKITVAPTVLVLDGAGMEAARYEGEEEATVESLRTRLTQLGQPR